MDAIELMVEEHNNIKRMLEVARKLCIKVINHDDTVDYNDFYKVIDFVRNYADKHHHNKEEAILFVKLAEGTEGEDNHLGKMTVDGMLVEHDLGRLFMMNLQNALESYEIGDQDARVDIIANTIGYTDLLKRHIFKEDNALYQFARNNLSQEALKEIDERCKIVEEDATAKKFQEKYLKLLEDLERSI